MVLAKVSARAVTAEKRMVTSPRSTQKVELIQKGSSGVNFSQAVEKNFEREVISEL